MGQSCGRDEEADNWRTGGDNLKSLHPHQPSGSADLAHSWLKVALLVVGTDRGLGSGKQKEPTLGWTSALTGAKI